MKRQIALAAMLFLLRLSAAAAQAPTLPTPTPQPTYTPRPTYTALPTFTLPVPTLTTASPEAETEVFQPLPAIGNPEGLPVYVTVTPYQLPTKPIPATLDEEIRCEKISLTLTFMKPKIQATLTDHFPLGRFLMVRVKLRSLTGESIKPLQNQSFTMLGSLWGRDISAPLDRANSNYANTRWEIPNLDYSIGSNGIETFLIFDIHPEMTNFELLFKPLPADAAAPLCEVRIPIPVDLF